MVLQMSHALLRCTTANEFSFVELWGTINNGALNYPQESRIINNALADVQEPFNDNF